MKSTMIFAVTREDGQETSGLWTTWGDYHAATFPPDTEVLAVHPLVIHGKTYAERKNSLYDLAVDIQRCDVGGLSQGELCDLCGYMETQGRRYGLLTEFRANAIC